MPDTTVTRSTTNHRHQPDESRVYVNDIKETATWTEHDAVIIVMRTGRHWTRCRLTRQQAASLADQLRRLTLREVTP